MKITAVAEVTYTCYLDEEKAKQVIDYAKENDISLEKAVWDLQFNGSDFEMYEDSTESDFSTESIEYVELEDDEEDYYNEEVEE